MANAVFSNRSTEEVRGWDTRLVSGLALTVLAVGTTKAAADEAARM